MNEVQKVRWRFPPTKTRSGNTRGEFDVKTVILATTDLLAGPTIITADLHSHTKQVFYLLEKYLKLEYFTVIAAGDMAGAQVFGSDGDPTEDYEFMIERCGEFYFSQGNHDLPSYDGDNHEKQLRNHDSHFGNQTLCSLEESKSVESRIGKIAGQDGIISDRKHPYKFHHKDYCQKMMKKLATRPRIFVTHDTPTIPVKYNGSGDNYVGNEMIFNQVNKYKPNIHIYGHCHHPTYHNLIDGVNYICTDARVIILIPDNLDYHDFLHQDLEEEYVMYDYYNQ